MSFRQSAVTRNLKLAKTGFFRAKPSTTRLTYVRNDNKAEATALSLTLCPALLSFRQSVATRNLKKPSTRFLPPVRNDKNGIGMTRNRKKDEKYKRQ